MSNIELNSVKPKLLHQTNNKSGLVGQGLFKTKSNWCHLSRNYVWFHSCEDWRLTQRRSSGIIHGWQGVKKASAKRNKIVEINWVKIILNFT